jgi:hypothetical protein
MKINAEFCNNKLLTTIQVMEILERTIENLHTRAHFIPASLNEDARTIDVVFVTENPVRTFTWEDGVVDETLLCSPTNIRTGRFATGMAVLDNHDRYSGTKSQIGVVENYRFENGKGIATLRFSKRKEVEEGQWQDAKDGILRGISVGYSVHKYEIIKEEGKRTQYTAVDWEPLEISFAPVQADAGASVRSHNSENNNDKNKKHHTMELKARALAVGLPETATLQEVERAEADVKTRQNNEIKEQARKEAVEAERKRVTAITAEVRKAGLEAEFAEKLIADGIDLDKSRELIINEVAEKNKINVNGSNRAATVGAEQKDKVRVAMEEAIVHRVDPSTKLETGRDFRGMRLLDMGKYLLEQDGVRTLGMSQRQVAMAALGLDQTRGYMSSSDFPIILGNTVNRTLRQAYEQQSRTFMPFCRRASAADFKPITRAQISALVGAFDNIPEGGEYKQASLTEGKEVYQLAKYGKKIALTWESLTNDDLSAFDRIPMAIAQKAAQKQSDIVYGIITDNAAMSDTVALFHADHGNLAGVAAAITSDSLALARAAMRKQKDLNGDFINVNPTYLIVGPDKETEAQKLIQAVIMATKTADTNVFKGSLQIIVEPRLTGNQWYLAASPGQVDTIEYAFLDGEGELFTEQRVGFDVDGLEIKARMVFAAKAIDYRGLFKNAGA